LVVGNVFELGTLAVDEVCFVEDEFSFAAGDEVFEPDVAAAADVVCGLGGVVTPFAEEFCAVALLLPMTALNTTTAKPEHLK
jgi:hypothetical protein